jgi:hypothetical protein
MAATPTTPATLATFLNARGFVCAAQDIAPTVGGTVGPFVLGKTPGNTQFGVAWGTVALPIVKAGVDALANGGMNMVCARFTATEIILMKGDLACVYPLATTTPGASICTDDTGLITDLLYLLGVVAPPMVG